MSESRNHSNILTFQHSNIIKRFFAGGHRGVVTPVPIPNTEVKGPIAEGSAGLARARVGRRRLFFIGLERLRRDKRDLRDTRDSISGALRATLPPQWLGS